MIARVPNSILTAERALDFDDVVYAEPLSFRFYYATNNQPDIIDTIYLEDGRSPANLVLEVFNESAESISFKKAGRTNGRLLTVKAGGDQAASRAKCHFQIHWAKDLLFTPSNIDIEESQQWQVNYDEDNRFFSLYFLHKNGTVLRSRGSDNDKIRLTFKNLAAKDRAVKTSNVELLYGGESSLVFKGEGSSEELIIKQISSTKAIYVTNYPTKQQIPLQVRWLGSNTVLNDATTENRLSLKVINSPLSNNNRPILRLDSTSKFIISFVKGNHPEALVATDTQLNQLEICTSSTGWTPKHTGNSTEWEFTATNINQLAEGEGITLSITKLVTSSASGLGYLYIDYQNIGSYPDGRLVVAIEKTPLLYKDQQVGIGTTNPSAKLHVAGGDAVIYGNVGIGTDNLKGKKLHLSGTVKATENNQTLIGLSVNPTFDNDGKTNVKQLGLEVVGTTATTEAETKEVMRLVRPVQTDVKYANSVGFNVGAFESGRNGKTRLDITLAGGPVSSNECGSVPNVTVMSLLADGKVGIGTTSPKKELHVVGDLVLGKDEDNKKFIFHSQGNNGDFLQITYDKSDGQFEWGQGITLTRGGNVGIGRTNPDTKLHVDGNIRLSGNIEGGSDRLFRIYPNTTAHNSRAWIEMWDNSDTSRTGELTLAGTYVDLRYNSTATNNLGSTGIRLTSEGKVGIGTTNPQATLDVHGNFYIKGKKPMELQRFTVSDNAYTPTGYRSSDWIAIIAGILAESNDQIKGIKAFISTSSSDELYLKTDLIAARDSRFVIYVLFIRKEMVDGDMGFLA